VQSGQNLVKKKGDALRGRADSFVVETNVHYPTDINLLFDAAMKTVEIVSALCGEHGIPGWRQSGHQLGALKRSFRICQKSKRSMSKDPEKQERKLEKDRRLHRDYMDKAEELFRRAELSLDLIVKSGCDCLTMARVASADMYLRDGKHQIDLISRRVLRGEKIPHEEKVFSLFQRHTEWISKGKAGVPQELGKRVCVVEDQYQFVLSHKLMDNIGDKEAVVPFIEKVKTLFPGLSSCSFDKGFWSPENKAALEKIISVSLPRPGRLSKEAKEYQSSADFTEAGKKHSAVESCINALENHGLGRCPDCGIKNFERYVSLAVLGRNIQRLGTVLIEKEKKRRIRSEQIKEGLMRKRLASAA
jgi:transposase, IS5 family